MITQETINLAVGLTSIALAIIAIILSILFYKSAKDTEKDTSKTLEKISLETNLLNNISNNFLNKIIEYAIHGKDENFLNILNYFIQPKNNIQNSSKAIESIQKDSSESNIKKEIYTEQLKYALPNIQTFIKILYHHLINDIKYHIDNNNINYKFIQDNLDGSSTLHNFITQLIELHNKNIILLESINPLKFKISENMKEPIKQLYKQYYK